MEALQDRDTLYETTAVLEQLVKALGSEKCGEVVHKKLLELYSTYGIKMPTAFVNLGKFHGRMGKTHLTLEQYGKALGCLATMDETRLIRMKKESVELDV